MSGGKIVAQRPPAVALAATAVTCAGLAALVVGTFLPWLRSGSVARNSYSADGSLRRLLGDGGAIGLALTLWPFVSLACAAAAGLLIVGVRRVGAGLAAFAAGSAGAVAVAVLAVHSSFSVRPALPGPAITTTGAAIALVAAGVVLIHGRTR